jgi:hypothetical protein
MALALYISELENQSDIFKDGTNNEKLNAWYKTLKVLEELNKLKAFDYNWKDLKWVETWNYTLDQKCLFYVNATWMYNIWEKIDKKQVLNMIPCELPTFKNATYYFGGYSIMWAVPKNSKNKDVAVKFLLSINTAEVADQMSRFTKSKSGIKGRIAADNFGADHFEKFNISINEKYRINKLLPTIDAALILGKTKRFNNIYILDVAYGRMTADEAMRKIKAGI